MPRILYIELSEAQAQKLVEDLPRITHVLYILTWFCLGVRNSPSLTMCWETSPSGQAHCIHKRPNNTCTLPSYNRQRDMRAARPSRALD